MATSKKTAPASGASRASKAYNKKTGGDLRLIKVWVAGLNVDPEGIEAGKVRAYAGKQPLTKSLTAALC